MANGITNGMNATRFGVGTPCNRAMVVTFLYRAMVVTFLYRAMT